MEEEGSREVPVTCPGAPHTTHGLRCGNLYLMHLDDGRGLFPHHPPHVEEVPPQVQAAMYFTNLIGFCLHIQIIWVQNWPLYDGRIRATRGMDPAALDAEERIYHNAQDVGYAIDENQRDLGRSIGRVRLGDPDERADSPKPARECRVRAGLYGGSASSAGSGGQARQRGGGNSRFMTPQARNLDMVQQPVKAMQ